jgi:O-antigen/teichoic acid export membrane protein
LKKIINHAYIYISGSVAQALVPFFLIPLLARLITQDQFGKLMLIISIGTVLSYAFSLGMPAILSRELIFQRSKLYFLKDLISRLQTLMIWISILFFVSVHFVNPNLNILILSIALALTLSVIQIELSIFRSEFKSIKFIILSILSTSLPMILVIFFTNYYISNIYNFYVATSILIVVILKINFLFKLPTLFTFKNSKNLIKIALPMILHGTSISLFQYGDKIASFFGIGSNLVAQVVFVSLFMTAPMLLLSTINNAWLPSSLEVFKQSSKKAFVYLHNSSKKLSILITFICLGIVIFSNIIVSTFVPITYNQLEITKAIIIGVSFTPLYLLYLQNTHIFTARRNFKTLAKITPIAATIQFLFTFILVDEFGLKAPAFGLLIATLIQVILTSIGSKSLAKLNLLPIYLTILLSSFNILYLNFVL